MIRNIIAFIGVSALFGWVAVAAEDDRWSVGVISGSAPYIIDSQAQTGLDAELLKAIASQLGKKLDLYPGTQPRLKRLLASGAVDTIVLHGEPVAGCHPSQLFNMWQNALFLSRRIDSDDSLDVITFPGAKPILQQRLAKYGIKLGKVLAMNDIHRGAELLRRRDFGGLFGDIRILRYQNRTDQNKTLDMLDGPIFLVDHPHRLCARSPELAAQLDKALTALADSGKRQEIMTEYIHHDRD